MSVTVVLENGFGHIFKKGCLTCLRWRYNHASLAFTDGTDKVYDTHSCCPACTFHYKTLIREDRRHILKIVSSLTLAWMKAVYGRYIEKCTELLTLSLNSDISLDDIACLQVKTADLGR